MRQEWKRKYLALPLAVLLLSGCARAEALVVRDERPPAALSVTEPTSAPPVIEEIPDTEQEAENTPTPQRTAEISLLGPNMVYVGEGFDFSFEMIGEPDNEPEISWVCAGEAGKITDDGKFTAVKKGNVTITVSDSANDTSSALTVHVVESSKDVDFVPKVNGIPVVNKTYPLSSDYDPGDITAETRAAYFELKEAALKDGIVIEMISGYRSYAIQKAVHNNWIGVYGSETADTLSARPGFSEHQLGFSMDVNSIYSEFARTPEGIWLNDNCWKYGFIIRYPAGKEDITGYIYEPWHIRYLGKELAEKVTKSGLCLEEYLGIDSRYREAAPIIPPPAKTEQPADEPEQIPEEAEQPDETAYEAAEDTFDMIIPEEPAPDEELLEAEGYIFVEGEE